jgi:hypothetical protein
MTNILCEAPTTSAVEEAQEAMFSARAWAVRQLGFERLLQNLEQREGLAQSEPEPVGPERVQAQ